MKNTRNVPSNDAIAFTRNCFETLAIEDFDVAAPVADHTGILQHTCCESYCGSPYTEHNQHRLI